MLGRHGALQRGTAMEGEPSASPCITTNLSSKRKALCMAQLQASPLAEDNTAHYSCRKQLLELRDFLVHSGQAVLWLSGAIIGLQLDPLLPVAPPFFLPSSNASVHITQSPAPQHCPLTQSETFLGPSTTQMSKTGKISPTPPAHKSYFGLLLV